VILLLVVFRGTEVVGVGYFNKELLICCQIGVLHSLFNNFDLLNQLLVFFKSLFLIIIARCPLPVSINDILSLQSVPQVSLLLLSLPFQVLKHLLGRGVVKISHEKFVKGLIIG